MNLHRVDKYARDVVSGKIVTGALVKLACERHQHDRDEEPHNGMRFHGKRANHAIDFIERWVRLPDTSGEDGAPLPFLLQPWQAFIVGSLFGWYWTSGPGAGHRRYRNAYIEVGKGNGKTPLLAAIGLYGLTSDGQKAPEIYAAASDRDQAMIMFRDAVRMVDASPELAARIHKSGEHNPYNLSYGLGFFRPFSREQGAKSGTRPHMGLLDEVHEQPSPDVINKIRAGAKGNQDALFAEITNSGFDRTSICWQHHDHSQRVLEGTVTDERWFAYVCTLDEGDDPLRDPTCHVKTNPNLGVSIHQQYLDDQVHAAKHIPAETNTVLRLNFCVWTQAHTGMFDMAKWHACPPRPPASQLLGRPCFGGVDLGQTDDLSAWARVWVLDDGYAVQMRYWLPRAALEKYPNRPYAEWQRAGLLTVTEGDTTDDDLIERTVLDDCRASGVVELGVDKRFAHTLMQHWLGAGLTVVDTPQGFALNESLRKIISLAVEGKLLYGPDPILSWMAANAITKSGERDGAIRLDKAKAEEKIDGIAALANAVDRIVRQPVVTIPAAAMFILEAR